MNRKYLGLAMGALIAAGGILSLPSCGHDQKLQSIQVQPSSYTFLQNVEGSTATYKAYGTYIHPPATKDISAEVTWYANVPGVAAMTSGATNGGVLTTAGGCGISDVSATAPEGTGGAENIVVGYGAVTVNDPTNPLCPGGSSTNGELVVTPAGTGTGSIASQPGGISCPGTACGAQFPAGDVITLTAAPGPNSIFGGWSGCTASTNPEQCSVTIPGGGVINVTATFTAQ
jgi:hypothetical protein